VDGLRRADRSDAAGIRRLLSETTPGNPKADAEVMTWQYDQNP
jgi:hypothetical protein